MDFRGRQAIFFITILCGVMNSESTPPKLTRYYVKHFILALQWSGAFRCPFRCPCNVSEDFYIHGLWEEPAANQCSRDRLNLPEDPQLIQKMKKEWPSIIGQCNETSFWEHEWQNHGYFSNLGQSKYFNKAIKLRERVDPLGALLSEGIHPSPDPYNILSIRGALNKIPGFARIKCTKDNVLSEIHFCVNWTASSFQGCPPNMKSYCRNDIYFLPCFPYNSRASPTPPRITPGNPGTTSRTAPGI